MGTQIHAGKNYRRVVELIQSGAIGSVSECHVWCPKNWANGKFVKTDKPVPAHLDWDLWLGPAPQRVWQPGIHPGDWRRFWEYGNGTLGDMGCHYMDLPFWALKLKYPTSVSAEGPGLDPDGTPDTLAVHWNYPARGEMPAVKVSWYDGNVKSKMPAALFEKDAVLAKREKEKSFESGVLFIGEKGMLVADYDHYRLFPEEKFKDFQPPAPTIPDSIGHHNEWIAACKSSGPTTCNFDYSGPLSEAILLGNVAFRVGQTLDWDAENLKARGCPAADPIIRREYRKGWEL